jgi:hypothetical protein
MTTLADAVRADHDCDLPSCQIEAALAQGYARTAPWFLALDTDNHPALTAHLAQTHGTLPPDLRTPQEWRKWIDYVHDFGRRCPSCESPNFARPDFEPERCGSCSAPLPPRS